MRSAIVRLTMVKKLTPDISEKTLGGLSDLINYTVQ